MAEKPETKKSCINCALSVVCEIYGAAVDFLVYVSRAWDVDHIPEEEQDVIYEYVASKCRFYKPKSS